MIWSQENFALECSILSDEGNSEWSLVGKVVVENLHTNLKKEASLKLEPTLEQILPCNSRYQDSKTKICENCTYLVRLNHMGKNQIFMSSISSKFIQDKRFNEKIEISLNFADEIIAFSYLISNYLEKHQFIEAPSALLSEAFEAPQMHFHSEEEVIKEKTGGAIAEDPQDQSFFKKYFWYIVIGGVLFFLLQSVDKEKLNDTMKKAQDEASKRQ